jgi:hypothetical protein
MNHPSNPSQSAMYSDAQYCTSLNESFFANTQANYIVLVHALNCKYKSLYMLCFYQKPSSLT